MASFEQQQPTFADPSIGNNANNEAQGHPSWMGRIYTRWDSPTGGITSKTGGETIVYVFA